MPTINPPPAYCDESLRRQADSVAVRNEAFPSTIYLMKWSKQVSILLSSSGVVHYRNRTTIWSLGIFPIQWPRYLDQIFLTLVIIQVELLGVRERNCSCFDSNLGNFAHLTWYKCRIGRNLPSIELQEALKCSFRKPTISGIRFCGKSGEPISDWTLKGSTRDNKTIQFNMLSRKHM